MGTWVAADEQRTLEVEAKAVAERAVNDFLQAGFAALRQRANDR